MARAGGRKPSICISNVKLMSGVGVLSDSQRIWAPRLVSWKDTAALSPSSRGAALPTPTTCETRPPAGSLNDDTKPNVPDLNMTGPRIRPPGRCRCSSDCACWICSGVIDNVTSACAMPPPSPSRASGSPGPVRTFSTQRRMENWGWPLASRASRGLSDT